jgi:hypothetical protein
LLHKPVFILAILKNREKRKIGTKKVNNMLVTIEFGIKNTIISLALPPRS